ncbi:MAG: HlyD family efflux transporter periplasmic adaptor subunit [Pirellulaceae bacterium]
MFTAPRLLIFVALAALLATSTVAFGQISSLAGYESFERGYGADLSQSLSNGVLTIKSAKLACVHKLQVAAQSDGLIQELLADEGHVVAKGDLLLRIDRRVAEAELDVAETELKAAEKQASQMAEVEYAKKASLVADEEYKAINELLGKGSSTLSETVRKRLEAERARLGIDVAVVKHENEILAADVAKAKVEAAKVRLELFDVKAEFDGIVVERLRDQGEWIRAGEPVLRLTHMNEMKVQVSVDVSQISPSQLEGAQVILRVPMNVDQEFVRETIVSFVSTEITGDRVQVTAKVPNEKIGDTWQLRDGMTASVEIRLRN